MRDLLWYELEKQDERIHKLEKAADGNPEPDLAPSREAFCAECDRWECEPGGPYGIPCGACGKRMDVTISSSLVEERPKPIQCVRFKTLDVSPGVLTVRLELFNQSHEVLNQFYLNKDAAAELVAQLTTWLDGTGR